MAMNRCLYEMATTAFLLVLLAIIPTAVSLSYTVGDASQWSSGVDYTVWVAGKTFRVGDTLEFKYGPSHSVDVVNEAGYDSCDSSTATEKHTDGDTEIELKTVGTKYFICPTSGHCISGMKLAVTVVAAATFSPPIPISPSPSPFAPSPSPGGEDYSPPADVEHEAGLGPTMPPPPPPPSPPPLLSGGSNGLMSYLLVGISLMLALTG